MIDIVGQCDSKLFGLTPAERLARQAGDTPLTIVAAASAVFDAGAVAWLLDHPGTLLADDQGRPLAAAVEAGQVAQSRAAIDGHDSGFARVTVTELGDHYIRKLRRRSPLLAFSLDRISPPRAERTLFDQVYKGVTDLITKWVWPLPALAVTRLCARLGISPNAVTVVGMLLTILAGYWFYVGDIGAALVAAWTMTFLDTVDGKLARVTLTSSRLGNWLDHGTDVIHPPLWWLCLANGLAMSHPGQADAVWLSCWIILGTYVVGRVIEIAFHRLFGFNAYLFARFDSSFRLVVARRNILLLFMTGGLLIGQPVAAFQLCALWSLVSVAVQAVRIAQAGNASRRAKLAPWIA